MELVIRLCQSAHSTKTQDHYPVECQAPFRAMPVNELLNGVTIAPLCICGVVNAAKEIAGRTDGTPRQTVEIFAQYGREHERENLGATSSD